MTHLHGGQLPRKVASITTPSHPVARGSAFCWEECKHIPAVTHNHNISTDRMLRNLARPSASALQSNFVNMPRRSMSLPTADLCDEAGLDVSKIPSHKVCVCVRVAVVCVRTLAFPFQKAGCAKTHS